MDNYNPYLNDRGKEELARTRVDNQLLKFITITTIVGTLIAWGFLYVFLYHNALEVQEAFETGKKEGFKEATQIAAQNQQVSAKTQREIAVKWWTETTNMSEARTLICGKQFRK